jgi:hypothetical protein
VTRRGPALVIAGASLCRRRRADCAMIALIRTARLLFLQLNCRALTFRPQAFSNNTGKIHGYAAEAGSIAMQ